MKLWQIWPGRNRFCFNGKVMWGPSGDFSAHCCAWSSILIISGLYLFYTTSYYLENNTFYLFLYLYSFFLTILMLVLTNITDPGIIPRRPIMELNEEAPEYYLNGIIDEEKDSGEDSNSN